jgi:hypothetical protein
MRASLPKRRKISTPLVLGGHAFDSAVHLSICLCYLYRICYKSPELQDFQKKSLLSKVSCVVTCIPPIQLILFALSGEHQGKLHISTGNLMQVVLNLAQPACSTISLTTAPFLTTLLICSGIAHSLSSPSVSLFGGSTMFTLLDLLVKTSVAILSLLR